MSNSNGLDGGFESQIPQTTSEIRDALATGLVSLDANVLLSFYRFSPTAQRALIDVTDHRAVGCGLLILASLGTMAGALARNSCEESVPRCEGDTFTTAADWVHGVGGLTEILGIAGAAIVLAAALPRPWSTYSATTGGAVLVFLLGWAAVPYPWVGTAERALALALVGWVAVMGTRLATARPVLSPSG